MSKSVLIIRFGLAKAKSRQAESVTLSPYSGPYSGPHHPTLLAICAQWPGLWPHCRQCALVAW